jgi:hypothetical protein
MRIPIIALLIAITYIPLIAQTDTTAYRIFINPAIRPGSFNSYDQRMYQIEKGELMVMKLSKVIGGTNIFEGVFSKKKKVKKKASKPVYIYDTTFYKLTIPQEIEIRHTLRSIHCIDSFISDFNIIDGLRFTFSCKYGFKEYSTWVSNAYHDKIDVFINMINSHVPEEWKIWYDKNELVNWEERCK